MLETLQISMVDLFKALPIPEKGEKGEPGINGTSVTVEQFRDLFEASYARFELETERRIMDLVQRTLDRIPVPKDGKDGSRVRRSHVVQTGERTSGALHAGRAEQGLRASSSCGSARRGVWKAGTAYERGDVVTWGGSSWIAQRDNPRQAGGRR